MIVDEQLSTIFTLVVRVTIMIAMVIHIAAIFMVARQIKLVDATIKLGGTKTVLFFVYLHVIILIVAVLLVLLLP